MRKSSALQLFLKFISQLCEFITRRRLYPSKPHRGSVQPPPNEVSVGRIRPEHPKAALGAPRSSRALAASLEGGLTYSEQLPGPMRPLL